MIFILSGLAASSGLYISTLGTFDERVEAIQAAVLVAESSGRFGRASGVLSQDEDGDMLPIWQVGRDAYSKLM